MKQFILYCSILFFAGCAAEVEDPIDLATYGYDYYPLEVGKYRIYQIDSIQFDLGAGNLPVLDSATFFMREEVVEKFADGEGIDVYRIERYRADKPDGPWQIFDVITQSRTVNQGYQTENNVRLINLVFPVKKGLRWDGTVFVKNGLIVFILGETLEMYKGWEFEILNTDTAEVVGNKEYAAVTTVQQSDSDNPIEKRFSIEKYAKGVGMVMRERQIVDSYCKYLGVLDQCIGKEWSEKAGRGFFTREVLIDHN